MWLCWTARRKSPFLLLYGGQRLYNNYSFYVEVHCLAHALGFLNWGIVMCDECQRSWDPITTTDPRQIPPHHTHTHLSAVTLSKKSTHELLVLLYSAIIFSSGSSTNSRLTDDRQQCLKNHTQPVPLSWIHTYPSDCEASKEDDHLWLFPWCSSPLQVTTHED